MTPLNFLTQSSDIINEKVYKLFKQNQELIYKVMGAIQKHKSV